MSVSTIINDYAYTKAASQCPPNQSYTMAVLILKYIREKSAEICSLHEDSRVRSLIDTNWEQLNASYHCAPDISTWRMWSYEVIATVVLPTGAF